MIKDDPKNAYFSQYEQNRAKRKKTNRRKLNYSSVHTNKNSLVRKSINDEDNKIFESFQGMRIRKGARKYQSIDFGKNNRSASKFKANRLKQH